MLARRGIRLRGLHSWAAHAQGCSPPASPRERLSAGWASSSSPSPCLGIYQGEGGYFNSRLVRDSSLIRGAATPLGLSLRSPKFFGRTLHRSDRHLGGSGSRNPELLH